MAYTGCSFHTVSCDIAVLSGHANMHSCCIPVLVFFPALGEKTHGVFPAFTWS